MVLWRCISRRGTEVELTSKAGESKKAISRRQENWINAEEGLLPTGGVWNTLKH